MNEQTNTVPPVTVLSADSILRGPTEGNKQHYAIRGKDSHGVSYLIDFFCLQNFTSQIEKAFSRLTPTEFDFSAVHEEQVPAVQPDVIDLEPQPVTETPA